MAGARARAEYRARGLRPDPAFRTRGAKISLLVSVEAPDYLNVFIVFPL